MSEDTKRLVSETVDNMKQMDKESLLIMKSNSEVLKARDAMDKGTEQDSLNDLFCAPEEKPEVTAQLTPTRITDGYVECDVRLVAGQKKE